MSTLILKLSADSGQRTSSSADSVVVIDVWRSFTTAAFAFAAGVREILVAASPEEAFALRPRFPDALLIGMGELAGKPAPGFDFGNSPADIRQSDLHGRRVILCTPNGTPGLARSVDARILLAGSLVCAAASVRYLRRLAPEQVKFVCTEVGIADQSCAEYMAALLREEKPDTPAMLAAVRSAWQDQARSLLARENDRRTNQPAEAGFGLLPCPRPFRFCPRCPTPRRLVGDGSSE